MTTERTAVGEWCGRVVEGAPEDRGAIAALVGSWVDGLADDTEWFVVELDPGRLELAWLGALSTSVDAPLSLTPALFPGGAVPASYPALLAVGSSVALDAWRSGVVLSVENQVATFYDELVDAEDRVEVRVSASAWLRRAAGDAPEVGGVPVVPDAGPVEQVLRRRLAPVRRTLDDDVEAIAASTGFPALGIRTQLVARAAHAHATRLWGAGPERVLAEAAALDALAANKL